MNKKSPTIKYKYALDLNRQVVDINDLASGDDVRRSIYICVSCGQPLIPVMGSVREKHFRHAVEGNCNPETYLHQLAKKVFYRVYSECLASGVPFYIVIPANDYCTLCTEEFGIRCKVETTSISYDLTKFFPQISLETPDGCFTPDILLCNYGEKLYVEFVVTHFSSPEKRDSGVRIIEFALESENDLEPVNQKLFSHTDPKIQFINFKFDWNLKKGISSCKNKFHFFMLKPDGSAFTYVNTPPNYKLRLKSGDIVYSKFLPRGGVQSYFDELVAAFQSHKKVNSCFLCRYHGENRFRDDDGVPIFCKLHRKNCSSTKAVTCGQYYVDQSVFPAIIHLKQIG
ncbi:MAG: competence protein CoiA family protein [Anaerolineaceae bacterium]